MSPWDIQRSKQRAAKRLNIKKHKMTLFRDISGDFGEMSYNLRKMWVISGVVSKIDQRYADLTDLDLDLGRFRTILSR